MGVLLIADVIVTKMKKMRGGMAAVKVRVVLVVVEMRMEMPVL